MFINFSTTSFEPSSKYGIDFIDAAFIFWFPLYNCTMDKILFDGLKKIYQNDILYKKEDVYPYAYDTSPNPQDIIPPEFVVFPKNASDVSKTVLLAKKHKIALIPRGAGTNHCGGCRVRQRSIVLHFSKMNKILDINKEDLTAHVQPNAIIGEINARAEKEGLFFPPDPSNLAVSTIGGAAALSSGGPRTFKYGCTKDYIINLEVVLSDGKIMKTGSDIAKNVTGYNLTSLFVGSEGTLGIITGLTLKLIPKPQARKVTLAYFKSLTDAAKAVNNIINSGFTPATIDLLDKNTLVTIEKFKPCGLLCNMEAALLIELDGFSECLEYEGKKIFEILKTSGTTQIVQAKNEEENEKIWRTRRSSFAAVTKLRPNVITEDVVVPRSKIVKLVEGIQKICSEHNIIVCIMGHAGDGNIHPNFALDLSNTQEKENFEKVKDKLFSLALSLGGSLSGEHGIGYEKRKYLPQALDPVALEYMGKIKKLFDSENIINPDKMF